MELVSILTEQVGSVADGDGDEPLRAELLQGVAGGPLSPEQLPVQKHQHREPLEAVRRLGRAEGRVGAAGSLKQERRRVAKDGWRSL